MNATYALKEGVLHSIITGAYTAADAEQNKENMARLVEETGVRLGIIDLRGATIPQSTVDIYEVNSTLEGLIPRDVRFALVYSAETLSREMAEFAENVLVNAGYDARVCHDYDEALRWVKSGG